MPSSTLPTSRTFITQLLNSLPGLAQPSAHAENVVASNPLGSAPEPAKKQLLALHVLFPNELLPALDLLDRHLITRFRIRREPEHIAKNAAPEPINISRSGRANVLRGRQNQIEAVAQSHAEQMARPGEASASGPETSAVGAMDPPDAEMLDVGAAEAHIEGALPHMPQTPSEDGRVAQDEGVEVAQQSENEDMDTVYYVRSAQQRSSRFSTSYDSTTSYEVRLKAWNCSCPAFAFAAFPSVHPEPPVPTYDPQQELMDNGNLKVEARTALQSAEWEFGGLSLGDGTPPVCKHLLACVLVERCSGMFGGFVEEKEVSVEEAAAWAAGWGD